MTTLTPTPAPAFKQGRFSDESAIVLGSSIQLLPQGELIDAIDALIRDGKPVSIGHHNMHSLYLVQHDSAMREYYQRARIVYMDGMGLVLLARALGQKHVRRSQRVTGVDFAVPLFQRAAERGWKVFYLGSRPGVGEKAAAIFTERFPGLRLRVAHGFFDASPGATENEDVLRAINEYKPDLLIVGMGMPRQERWVLENFERLSATATLCVGAMMDYYAGAMKTPPRWMSRLGFEWLARLVLEPRRLWFRYLVEPWFVVKLLLRRPDGRRQ